MSGIEVSSAQGQRAPTAICSTACDAISHAPRESKTARLGGSPSRHVPIEVKQWSAANAGYDADRSVTDSYRVKVFGRVCGSRAQDGFRVTVPFGIYRMEALGIDRYRLSGPDLPTIELASAEVAAYMNRQMNILDDGDVHP